MPSKGNYLKMKQSFLKKNVEIENTSLVSFLVGYTISDLERALIFETLEKCLWNKTLASTLLGISDRTLRNKLAKYKAEGRELYESKKT